MRIILIGSPTSDPALQAVSVVDRLIKSHQDAKQFIRVYFLDHRIDTRTDMTTYIVEDNPNTNLNISYKVSTCTLPILSELADGLLIESKYSAHQNRVILYFNLDSVTSNNLDILRSTLDNFQTITEKIDLDIVCLSTTRVLDHNLLDRFDQIHMFNDTSPPATNELMAYLVKTGKYYEIDTLQRLISLLDVKSDKEVQLSSLINLEDRDIASFGRIVASDVAK